MKRALAAVLVGGTAISMTDWFFQGVLFHDKYLAYPEIWRTTAGSRETLALCTAVGFLTCAAFVMACDYFRLTTARRAFAFAVFVWLIGPLPLLLTFGLYIKLHPLIIIAHSLGWLARLSVAAAVVVMIVRDEAAREDADAFGRA